MRLEIERGRRPGYVAVTVFLGVAASVTYAVLRLYQVIPSLPCYWRELFGIRCPGCGTTTTLQHLLRLDPASAFSINPLMAAAYLAAALVSINGLVGVIAGRRIVVLSSRREGWIGAVAFLLLLAANWVYVYLR